MLSFSGKLPDLLREESTPKSKRPHERGRLLLLLRVKAKMQSDR
jgi:hypothetical protein